MEKTLIQSSGKMWEGERGNMEWERWKGVKFISSKIEIQHGLAEKLLGKVRNTETL